MRTPNVPARALFAAIVLFGWQAGANAGDSPTGFTLSNGLRVRLVPVKGVKEVAILLGVRAGFFDEPPGLPHLAHVTEHLVVFSAPPEGDEGEFVDRGYKAGKVNGQTLPGFMYFDLRLDPEDLRTALKVQAARLTRPEFPEAVLTREIPRALAELEYMEQPETFGTGRFAPSAFVQAILYGRTEVPIKARTRGITVGDVRQFHARTFRVDRAMLVVVGDFDPATTRKVVEDAFSAIPAPEAVPDRLTTRTTGGPVTARWDASTRHLILAWRMPTPTDPDHAAVTVAMTALTRSLPLDREIAALTKSPVVTNEVEGFCLVAVEVNPGSDASAVGVMLLDRVSRLATPDGFSDAQVDQACQEFSRTVDPSPLRMLFSSIPSSLLMTRTNVELQRMARAIVWGDLDAYAGRVKAMDGRRVRDAVARLLDPGKAVVVRVEPMK